MPRAPRTGELVTDFYKPDPAAARNALREETAPRFLGALSKVLEAWGSGEHIVGAALSLADVATLDALTNYDDRFPGDLAERYPSLATLQAKLAQTPKLAAYLSGPRRRGLPDAAYLEHVKRCF